MELPPPEPGPFAFVQALDRTLKGGTVSFFKRRFSLLATTRSTSQGIPSPKDERTHIDSGADR
jgi:hypothetical protein